MECKYTATCNGKKEARSQEMKKTQLIKAEYGITDTNLANDVGQKNVLSCKRAKKASFIQPISLPPTCGGTTIHIPFYHRSAMKLQRDESRRRWTALAGTAMDGTAEHSPRRCQCTVPALQLKMRGESGQRRTLLNLECIRFG